MKNKKQGLVMAERFELFRLSLLERDQIDLFKNYDDLTREGWLLEVFKQETPFSHHGTDFYFSPALDESDNKIIIGRIGRHVLREENLPPNEGLHDITRDTWMALRKKVLSW